MIEIEALSAGYMGCKIIHDINLKVNKGAFFALVGPNGSGKSTLLHTISGQIKPYGGYVRLNGKDLAQFSKKARAKHIAVLEQMYETDGDLTVYERVSLGRIPHQSSLFQADSAEDHAIIEAEMHKQNISIYKNQLSHRLSGGEQQRVRIAKTLAQQVPILILDEPTNHLDLHHTIELLQQLKVLQAQSQLTVIAVLHDVNLAARFADEIGVMDKGKLIRLGSPKNILDTAIMKEVFQIDSYIVNHPTLQCPQFFVK